MRWMLLLMSVSVAAGLWLPGEAAQPAPPSGGNDKITFAQYRDWRDAYNERRRGDLAMQLSRNHLPAAQRARLAQVKAYYDWLAGLSEADRDRRYRERFELIDTDHDGSIDAAERSAWRDKQRAFYRRAAERQTSEGAPAEAAEPVPAAPQ
jgi:hypothetical protein